MVTTTLDAMAAGGIYDHVGGGFARYSTDADWLVPHFEKMLYDQALLVGAYLRGYLRHRAATRGTARIVEETIAYVLRDLRHPDGGFYSAEDADSEGVEGKFFLWSLEELTEVCGDDGARGDPLLRRDRGRQLPRSAHRLLGQHPPPRRPAPRIPVREITARAGRSCSSGARRGSGPASTTRCCSGGTRCSSARWPRPPPRSTATTGWRPPERTPASSSTALRRDDGRLLRSWHADGGGRHLAVAEDYAALLEALRHRWPRSTTSPGSRTRRGAPPSCSGLFHDEAERRVLHHRHRRRGADRAAPGLLRQRDPVGELARRRRRCSGSPRSPATTRSPSHPGSSWRCSAEVAGAARQSFAFLLGAYERAITPPIEVASSATTRRCATRSSPA